MSTAIQAKIRGAVKVLLAVPEDAEISAKPATIDHNRSAIENAVELGSTLVFARREIERGWAAVKSITASRDEWTDLMRKMSAVERGEEAKLCEAFERKLNVSDAEETARGRLKKLERLETVLAGLVRLCENKTQKEERALMAALPQGTSNAAVATSSHNLQLKFQLPTVTVDRFSGSKREWPEFYEGFKAAVHNKLGSKTDKLTILRTMLEGEPQRLIAGLSLTEDNYDVAMKLLRDTYGEKTAYIRALHSELANLKTCYNLADTREFAMDLERVSRELEAVGEDIQGPQTYLALEKKLNWKFLEAILDEKAKDPTAWNTTTFRTTLANALRRESAKHEIFAEYHPERRRSGQVEEQYRNLQHGGVRFNRSPQQRDRRQSQPPKRFEQTFASINIRPQSNVKKQPNRAPIPSQGRARPIGRPPLPLQEMGVQQWNPRRPPPAPCAFCNGNHWQDACFKFRTTKQRIEEAKKRSLCLRCLRKGHDAPNCRAPARCFKCRGNHPTALCTPPLQRPQHMNAVEENTPSVTSPMIDHTNFNGGEERNSVLLQTLQITIFNPMDPKQSLVANVFIDGGSTKSFVTEEAANRLGLKPLQKEECTLHTFGSETPKKYVVDQVKLGLLGRGGERYIFTLNKIKFLVEKMPMVKLQTVDEEELHNRSIDLPKSYQQPDLLLGMDVFHDLDIRELQRLPSGFCLSESRFGKILSGMGRITERVRSNVIFLNCVTEEMNDDPPTRGKELDEKLSKFFGLNTVGMSDTTLPDEEQEVLRNFKANLTFIQGRYEVALPWNYRRHELPANYSLAKRRLAGTFKRLIGSKELLAKYHEVFQTWLEKHIIEKVENPSKYDGPVHYLPHRPVTRTDKQHTKVRPVFDASARPKLSRGLPSLNDCLSTGPNLLHDLTGILIRFRLMRYVLLADLESAFLQLGIRPQDRDSCRFLWVEDPFTVNIENFYNEKFVVFRFRRVSFGLNASPFLLNATVKEHLSLFDTEIARKIENNIYVDNLLVEIDEPESVPETCRQIQEIFKTGGMKAREFCTNVGKGLDGIPDEDKLPAADEQKFLGIAWNIPSDRMKISFPPNKLQNGTKITKRVILSNIASVFDPMGLLSPALLSAKMFLQEIWSETPKLDWDEEINTTYQMRWQTVTEPWQNGFCNKTITFPRFIGIGKNDEYHAFADASGGGFGFAIYRRKEGASHLIFAKSMVKPAKLAASTATIPRLELHALALTVKAVKFLQSQAPVNEKSITLWTDSRCSIERLKFDKRYDRYVMNRLVKIRGTYSVNHIATQDNPADFASRGCSPATLSDSTLWWEGPAWLKRAKDIWPPPLCTYIPGEELSNEVSDEECEQNSGQLQHNATFNVIQCQKDKKEEFQQLINPERFSKWTRLKRATAYALRFLGQLTKNLNCKSTLFQKLKKQTCTRGKLSAEELSTAEWFLIKSSQEEQPPDDEMRRNLRLFLDDGLWRAKGRLQEADLDEETICPILLNRHSRITELLILFYHKEAHHIGANTLLSRIRSRFWLPQGRKTIQRITAKCLSCKKFRVQPYQAPFAPLPAERTRKMRPFGRVGVDLFGPMKVKSAGQAETRKIYGVIFTCLNVRATHLDVVNDLSAAAFLLTYRRFVARRGAPALVFSDNATNFTLASKTVMAQWNAEDGTTAEAAEFAQNRGTVWQFITPRAPWRGGAWERLIGVTKYSLKRTIGRSLFTYEEMITLLCEVESIVNSRPITFLSDNADEIGQALRPIDFILPYPAETQLPAANEAEDPNDPDYFTDPKEKRATELNTMFRKTQNRMDKFWALWINDYLLSLRERDRQSDCLRLPQKGDIVLIEQEESPRSQWLIGRIIDLHPGRDKINRTATLVAGGKTIKRAINLLYPIEIQDTEPSDSPQHVTAAIIQSSSEQSNRIMEVSQSGMVTIESSLPPGSMPTQKRSEEEATAPEQPPSLMEDNSSTTAANNRSGKKTSNKGNVQEDNPKWKYQLIPSTYKIGKKRGLYLRNEQLMMRNNDRLAHSTPLNPKTRRIRRAPRQRQLGDACFRMLLHAMGNDKEFIKTGVASKLTKDECEAAAAKNPSVVVCFDPQLHSKEEIEQFERIATKEADKLAGKDPNSKRIQRRPATNNR